MTHNLDTLVSMIPEPLRKAVATVRFRNVALLYKLPRFTETLAECPICAGAAKFEYKNAYTELDRCERCGHVYARRQPGDRILRLIYGKFAYWHFDKRHQGITKIAYGPEWEGYLQARIGILQKTGILSENCPTLRFFEVGCSEGMLLWELKRRGHEAAGCEMNAAIASAGREALGVDIAPCPFDEMETAPRSYDVVVSFHTIEHLRRPAATFEKIRRMLKQDGVVLVEVPCGREEYDNTDHLHFFSRGSLETLIRRHVHEATILENAYTNPTGQVVQSLYGVGRRPRQ